VADDKITLFCKDRPLRDVMRQISTLFNFTWERSGGEGGGADPSSAAEQSDVSSRGLLGYRYRLTQSLRAQLLEEELRNRDKNEALLAMDKEMGRYKKYGHLSPEQAKALAENASGEERKVLETLAGPAGAAVHLYGGLSLRELSALQSGQALTFGPEPGAGEQPLSPELAGRILQGLNGLRLVRDGTTGQPRFVRPGDPAPANALPPASVPEAHASAVLQIDRSELGQLSLWGGFGVTLLAPGGERRGRFNSGTTLAVGVSPSVRTPANAAVNAGLAHEAALTKRVTIVPEPSCRLEPDPFTDLPGQAPGPSSAPRVTTADVLEAIHRATGRDVIGDYYTRLYAPAAVAAKEASLFDALSQLSDATRLRWGKEGTWLTFRTTSFFQDRLKEIPDRLLSRWAASRREKGVLTTEDLTQIAQLSDAQLDAQAMAEGARAVFGLKEWGLARSGNLRPHWRLLGVLPAALRKAAQQPRGVSFTQLSFSQQQQLVSVAFRAQAERLTPEGLAGASLQVSYRPPSPPQSGSEKIPKPKREGKQEDPGDPRNPGDPDVVAFTYGYGTPGTERFRVVRRLYSERIESPAP
jgi:hypothetical protein